MRYVSQVNKTLWDEQPLVSGIGCQPETAFDEFLSTKLLHHKNGGVMFYHMLEEQIPQKEQRLAQLQAREANVDAFIEKAKQYTTIDTLTPELLRLFIQRIEIGERDVKYSRNASQAIRIIYRDIGLVDSAMQPDEKQPKLLPPLSEVIQFPA